MTIRDLPDATRDRLAERAARAGQSLQEYMKATLVDLASTPTSTETIDAIRDRVRGSSASVPTEETVRVLRALRNSE